MNGAAFDPSFDPRSATQTINRWIAGAARDCAMAATQALEAYRFDEAANRLYAFVWGTFCDWYLEFSKPILQGGDAAAQSETRATIGWVLAQIVHLLHPLMPYVTEEIWAQLHGRDGGLLLTAAWPDLPADLHDPDSAAEMETIIDDLSKNRAARSDRNVQPNLYIDVKVEDTDSTAIARLQRYQEYFSRLVRLNLVGLGSSTSPYQSVSFSGNPATTTQVVSASGTFVWNFNNTANEKERLTKEIEKCEAELQRLTVRLTNPTFLSKAKAETIEEQRERQADVRRDRDRLKAAYERLEAV
jgi:valyl-tRNA synthetase